MRKIPMIAPLRTAALATACVITLGGLATSTVRAAAEQASPPPNVVVSIAPVHSLVAGVMAGVGEPTLLVKGGASPHTYALKPSDAAALASAGVVFRVGPGLEAFLNGPLDTLASQAKVVDLSEAPGLQLMPLREGGIWEPHDHGHADHDAGDADHDHDHAAEEHGHEDADHAADEHGHEEADHAGAHHDHEDERDMHVWLDPVNAVAMTKSIVATLSDADPANAARYAENGAAVEARLAALNERLSAELAPVRAKPFIVFHDAYQYFDARYGLDAVGAITIHPDRAPGAERISEIRATIADRGAVCVFAEPQFEPRVVTRLVEDTGVRTGILDPDAAAGHTPGPDLYFGLMTDLADNLVACLDGSS